MKQFILYSGILIATLQSYKDSANKAAVKANNNDSTIKNKAMQNNDFSTRFLVSHSPATVFNAVNNVRGWWSEQIEGSTDKPDSVFNYHYKDVHRCTMKIIEFVPNQKVVWLVTDNYFNFTKDKTEWKGTKISFDISKEGDQTKLVFTHIGLEPAYECYKICADSWTNYVNGSLKSLIETGQGKPNPYEASIKNAAALKKENNK